MSAHRAADHRERVSLTVDGAARHGRVEPNTLLVHYLRDATGSNRVRDGCDTGRCGECTVLLDGVAAKSCNLFTVQVSGAAVDTLSAAAQESLLEARRDRGEEQRPIEGAERIDQSAPPFEYHRPDDLGEAIALLGEFGEEGRLIAGGQVLVPLLKRRALRALHLIDIRRLKGLSSIRRDRIELVIGGTANHSAIALSDLVRSALPVLSEVAAGIGDRADRNMGTIGGSLAYPGAQADWGAAAVAFGAEIVVANLQGEKCIPAADFFRDGQDPALESTDVITSVRFRLQPPRTGGACERLRPAQGSGSISAVALLTLDAAGKVAQARVGLAGHGGSPVRAAAVEGLLAGRQPDDATIAAAAALVPAVAAQPPEWWRRHDAVRELVARALRRAAGAASRWAG